MSFYEEDIPYRTLPYRPSPTSDQQYMFALKRVQDQLDMMLTVINGGDSLSTFDDGKWLERLLPIYDNVWDFLSPVHYGSLTGALVEVSATAMYQEGEGEEGIYLQVREMHVLEPGVGRRLV